MVVEVAVELELIKTFIDYYEKFKIYIYIFLNFIACLISYFIYNYLN